MKESVEIWQEMHKNNNYFNNHDCYQGDLWLSNSGMEGVTYLDPHPGVNILEIGCGYGRLLYHLCDVFDHVIGCDVAKEPLCEAFNLLMGLPNSSWELIKTDGVSLNPIECGSIDRIISINVFQHLPRTLTKVLIEEVGRVLKKGGLAALQFLSGECINVDIDVSRRSEQSLQYSEEQLRQLPINTRLEVVQIVHQPIVYEANPTLSYKWL